MADLDLALFRERIAPAIDARFPGATLAGLDRLHGGVSSLTFGADLDGVEERHRRIVIKVAPPGLAPVRNRDVLRQARVLKALRDAPGVRVPDVLFEDGDLPPLFGMDFVAGDSYEPRTDVVDDPPSPDTVGARARNAARMLARLQDVDPAAVGLGDEPVMALRDELDRWAALFATCPDDLRGAEQELHERLGRGIPAAQPPRILHGDYRLANMQFVGERAAAIIDWEIWSIGDPRTDLAWLLMHTDPRHRFAGPPDEANRRAGDGMPSADELLATYRAERAIDAAELPWFLAYCHYKCASTIAVLAKQNRRRETPDVPMERAAGTLPAVVARGLELLQTTTTIG